MTIREIAEIAGVSTATVSKVINNKVSDIGKETQARILAIIETHNYVPFKKVVERVSSASTTVALLISDVSDIFCSELLRGVEDYFFEKDFNVIICSTDGSVKKEKKYLHMLHKQNIKGVIRFPTPTSGNNSSLEMEHEDIFGVVLDDYKNSSNSLKTYFNNKEGGRIATQHLMNEGHKLIGYISPKNQKPYMQERFSGYCLALESGHIEMDHNIVYNTGVVDRKQCGYEGAKYLLSQQVSAIFCCDDHVAVGAYRAIQENGLKIPRDISVVGFDDTFFGELMEPRLTSIRQSAYDIGQSSANLLYRKVSGLPLESESVQIQPSLVSRDSVAAPDGNREIGPTSVVVIGDINADVVMSVEGKTSLGLNTASSMNVKPSGYAVKKACEFLESGSEVYLVGCIGNDTNGHQVFDKLSALGIHLDGIVFSSSTPTGTAFIIEGGTNTPSQTVYAGANKKLDEKQLISSKWIFQKADICHIQPNLPESLIQKAKAICVKSGTKITF